MMVTIDVDWMARDDVKVDAPTTYSFHCGCGHCDHTQLACVSAISSMVAQSLALEMVASELAAQTLLEHRLGARGSAGRLVFRVSFNMVNYAMWEGFDLRVEEDRAECAKNVEAMAAGLGDVLLAMARVCEIATEDELRKMMITGFTGISAQ